MSNVCWGILGTAKIAREKVIPAMQRGKFGQVVAIASRSIDAAAGAAARLGIPRAHGSYEALLADPEVDAVYIPLPNDLHVPWSIRAIEAGKHVLCEKPIGMDTADAEKLLEVARAHPELKVMEAFMYRLHPQWERSIALVRDGAIGEVRTVHTIFSYFNTKPENIRNRPESGGGALMDIGCYGVSLSRLVFDAEPERVQASMDLDPVFGTDRLTSALLSFPTGTATFTCSTQLAPRQRVEIHGTAGRIEILIPFNAPPDRPCRVLLERADESEEIVLPVADQYTIQGDRFARAVLDGTPVPTPLEDAVANMRVIDAVRENARMNSAG